MCGEYGEKFGRPHYHAIIFGFDFNDKLLWKKSGQHNLYTSKTLTALWGKGYTSIAEVNFETAAYVARYIMKKITGDEKKINERYGEKINTETGEIVRQIPEFNRMSLREGIGKIWLQRYSKDIINDGMVVINGRKVKAPRYYDRTLKKLWPEEYKKIAWQREEDAWLRAADATPARLAVREAVALARASKLSRLLEGETQ